jgi:hypothetical protein
MKKLVKTAKQQFEEDLNNLTLVRTWKMCDSEIYHHCVNGAGHFILFREQDEEYKILMYHKTYEELVLSEEFLFSVTQRFIDGRAEIKQLYNWYASADHENEPFNLLDVYMSDLEAVNNTYEDEYEEVPDVRVITAKEQWENDSKEANTLYENKDETLKVLITDEYVKFYRHDDAITCYTYPPLEKMRTDRWFVCQIVDILSESCEHDKISPFIKWTRTGGDFPLPISIIFNSDYQDYTCHVYEDKELSQEQSIEEMIALTPEQQEKVKEFEVALKSLKDSGVKIISYWDENEFYAVNGNCNVEFDCSYYLTEEEYNETEDISSLLEKNHVFPFSWDLHWGCDTAFCAKRL